VPIQVPSSLPGRPPPPSATTARRFPTLRSTRPRRRRRYALVGGPALATFLLAAPAFAAAGPASLPGVIDSLRNWLVGLLAALATLFLTIGGLRYITAGGDPAQVERAKTALKSAAIGYALAALAPLLVSILASVVGG